MFKRFTAILAAFCMTVMLAQLFAGAASGQPRESFADVTLIAEKDAAMAGDTFFAAFELDITDGWHVYWRNPGDAGLPPEPVWDTGGDLAGEFIWPAPHELPVIPDELLDYGYEDRLVLPFPVTVPTDASGSVRLAGELRYLICKDICIPEEAAFELDIDIATDAVLNTEHGQTIGAAIAMAPTPLGGETCFSENSSKWTLSLADSELAGPHEYFRFFPYEQEIRNAVAQPSVSGPAGAQLSLTPGYDFETSLPTVLNGIVIIEKAGGVRQAFEISAAQCAPLAGTSGASAGGAVRSGGGSNVLMLGLWALLGGLILNLMPCVLPVLSMKVLGIVGAGSQDDGAHLRAHGIWYTVGVLATFAAIAALFVGLRSAGQFLSVGFQLQNATAVAGLSLLMFVIGLWLLGMFEFGSSVQGVGSSLAGRKGSAGAFFTGLLAAIVGAPCIGPFLGVALGAVITEPAPIVFLVFLLVGLGLALPFLLISFVPGLHRILPKPGAWMERLKQFFAFPMFLTALWLLTVLADLAGADAIIGVGLGAVGIAFGIWLFSIRNGDSKPLVALLGAAAIIVGGYFGLQNTWAPQASIGGTQASGYGERTEPAVWSEANVQAALEGGQGVFVDFTASWCATCQLNKATTLKKPAVQAAFAEHDVVFMVADFTRQDSDIAAALQEHKRPGVPMYLYYAPGSRTPVLLPQLLSEALIMEHLDTIG
ncbi:MAG: protein-disulfide reductase DsbD domain-containing protein [Hyphomonadaceae bacterium]